jgi:hypothetical protein
MVEFTLVAHRLGGISASYVFSPSLGFLGKLTSPQLEATRTIGWISGPEVHVPLGGLEVLKTLLKNGANPFVWYNGRNVWFQQHSGIIYPDAKNELRDYGVPPAPPDSLRRMLELKSLPAARDILSLLPSHEAYEEEWNKCLKVEKKEARGLQGFLFGPEQHWRNDLPAESTDDLRDPQTCDDDRQSGNSDPQAGDDGSRADDSAKDETVKDSLHDGSGAEDLLPSVTKGEEGTGGLAIEIQATTSCAEPPSTAPTQVATHGDLEEEEAIPPATSRQKQPNHSTQATRNGKDQVAYRIQPFVDASPLKGKVLELVSHPAFTFSCGKF